MPGSQLDLGLAASVLWTSGLSAELLEVCLQRLGLGNSLLERLLRQRQHRASGCRLDAITPGVVGLHQLPSTEIITVGQNIQHSRFAVLPKTDLVDLAMGDKKYLIGRLTLLDDRVTGPELPLHELAGQRGEHLGIVEIPQHRQLTQFV